MKKSRITAALLAIGISASMVFQTPVFATEETAVAASSGITTNGIGSLTVEYKKKCLQALWCLLFLRQIFRFIL